MTAAASSSGPSDPQYWVRMDAIPGVPHQVSEALLKSGEKPTIFTWARIQRFGTPRVTFVTINLVVSAVDAFRNRAAMSKLRRVSAEGGIPLDRGMAICVTPTRILIWSASPHRRRVKELIGDLPRDRIVSASLPFVGGGSWRTVLLTTSDKVRIRLQIESQAAESFVNEFTQSS